MALSKPQINKDNAAVDAAVKRHAASWIDNARVCVALSGGVDSVVLLHAVVALRERLDAPWRLLAHHVHHGLSPNADAWATHCQTLCTELNVPLTIHRVRVDRESRMGIEAAAREARYESLDRLDKVDAQIVLLAHHARDQAETVLLQLLRGSGTPGLAAMPRATERYERPLLGVSKASINDYAALHALSWVTDESNDDVRFARNRLRAQVWPELVRAFPSAEVTLSRAAAHQAEAATLLENLAEMDAVQCVAADALQMAAFNALSRPRRANLLRYWLAQSSVDVPGTETLREWLKQLASVAPTQAICLRCANDGASIRVYRGAAWVVRDPVWTVRDAQRWQAAPWRGEPETLLQGERGVAGRVMSTMSQDANALRLPLTGENWTLRMRESGDAITLSPRSGRVTVKNIFQNAGLPPWQRERWPILVCDAKVVAVVGIATANAYTVQSGESGVQCEWKPA